MENHSFNKTMCNHCVFVKKFVDNDFIILLLYADDMLIVGQNTSKIDNPNKERSKSFAMKDLGPVKQIIGMKICHDRKSRKLWLSQELYVERVLERFNMAKAKSVYSPLVSHFKFSYEYCPTSEKEKQDMRGVSYASAVSSLMYTMVRIRPDIVHAVSIVS